MRKNFPLSTNFISASRVSQKTNFLVPDKKRFRSAKSISSFFMTVVRVTRMYDLTGIRLKSCCLKEEF